MKLRGKLVILESVISVIFFLSLLLSISFLSRSMGYSTLMSRTLRLNSQNKRLIQETHALLYQRGNSQEDQQVLWDLVLEYTSSYNRLVGNRTLRSYDPSYRDQAKALQNQWLEIQVSLSPTQMQVRYQELYGVFGPQIEEIGLNNLARQILAKPFQDRSDQENELLSMVAQLKTFVERLDRLSPRIQNFFSESSQELVPARNKRLRNILLFNLISIILSVIIVFSYRSRLLDMVNYLKKAMDQVSSGDLSARLRIRSKDEFGKLSRDFNTVIEILWAKLETVQNILEDVGKSISNEINLERAEKAILYLAKKNSSADGVALFIVNSEGALEVKHIQGQYHPPFKVGETDLPEKEITTADDIIDSYKEMILSLDGNILGETAQQGQPSFWKVAEDHWDLKRDSQHPFYFSSLINLPLRVGNRVLGVLSLVKNNQEEHFSDLEYTNMQSFGELAAISIDNLLKYLEMLEVYELNREIDIAADIQKDLLPQQIPRLQSLDIELSSRTLRGINGDFYDAYLLSNNKLLVVTCEVAGKGVPAALVIIMLKTILKLVAKPDKNAAQIIEDLNKNITERIKIENIATLSLMVVDNQNQKISYGSAGHQPMLIYNSDEDEFQELKPKGIPVGLDKEASYENLELDFESNKIYLQYTDGVPETRDTNGKIYGIEGIQKVVRKHHNQTAKRLSTEILDDLSFFQRDTKQWDDQTLLVMTREAQS